MTDDEKIETRIKYRLQTARIRRLNLMMVEDPESKERYAELIKNARQFRFDVEQAIENIDGSILSEILSQRYICGRSFEDVGYEVNYSRRQIERLHRKALKRLKFPSLHSL